MTGNWPTAVFIFRIQNTHKNNNIFWVKYKGKVAVQIFIMFVHYKSVKLAMN